MGKTLTDSRTVTISEAVPRLQLLMQAQLPAFLWAGAGVGKSSIVKQLAEALGGVSLDVRLHNMQPTDLVGIPYFNKSGNDGQGTMSWAPPAALPTAAFAAKHPIVLLFLDELNTAPPATQSSAYQLVLDRKVGEYKLPDNVLIIAAGNRETDRGVTYRMPSPLANRFVHLEIVPDFNSWFNWATTIGNQHPDVVGFLSWSKNSLSDFDSKTSSRAFATPRSWEFVSRILHANESNDDALISDLIAGTVGDGAAAKFMGYRKIGMSLPKPSQILDGTVTEMKNKDISAQYSIIVSLVFEMRENWHRESTLKEAASARNPKELRTWKSDKAEKLWMEQVDNFMRFTMNNFDVEVAIMAARMALKNYALPFQPGRLKEFSRFSAKYGSYITNTNAK